VYVFEIGKRIDIYRVLLAKLSRFKLTIGAFICIITKLSTQAKATDEKLFN